MAPVTAGNVSPAVKDAAVHRDLTLPLQILTQSDVSRLDREIHNLNDFFTEAAIRGATNKTIPQMSLLMATLCNENKINILQKADRDHILAFITTIHSKAPVVHVSFAVDPKPEFLMKLMHWFRTEAHPFVLFKVGLQPTLAAGCIIRTTNKSFDFSFKHHFSVSKQKLALALGAKK